MDKNKNNEVDFNEVLSNGFSEEQELTATDFQGGLYLKNPQVDEEIEFTIQKIVNNKNTEGTNSVTGVTFDIGLKYRDGTVKRYDIYTDKGIYTISNWEIFFKLLGSKNGLLQTYAKKNNNSFTGAKIKIKKLLDGTHASLKVTDLAKILGKSVDEAKVYQENIKTAIKEQRLYNVSMLSA